MSTPTLTSQLQEESLEASIQPPVMAMVDDLIGALPNSKLLSADERRGIIARYTAVLEGNFIYWMTATNLAVRSDEARPILLENLLEEVRDSHPVMLRKFAIAAHAFPTDKDALAVDVDLTKVRLFLGKLQGVQSLLTMAFFETFIQRFMPYLADLAATQGSKEMVYTDVHGVCDIAHSEGLFRAVSLEMSRNPVVGGTDLFEGVDLLRTLMYSVVQGPSPRLAA
jgi:Iron-containing redox enzyme